VIGVPAVPETAGRACVTNTLYIYYVVSYLMEVQNVTASPPSCRKSDWDILPRMEDDGKMWLSPTLTVLNIPLG
jgi:hypothetical protein